MINDLHTGCCQPEWLFFVVFFCFLFFCSQRRQRTFLLLSCSLFKRGQIDRLREEGIKFLYKLLCEARGEKKEKKEREKSFFLSFVALLAKKKRNSMRVLCVKKAR